MDKSELDERLAELRAERRRLASCFGKIISGHVNRAIGNSELHWPVSCQTASQMDA